MNDVAVYVNASKTGVVKDYITVFSFTDEAAKAVDTVIIRENLRIYGPKSGNKPGSLKYQVYCTKEKFNSWLVE